MIIESILVSNKDLKNYKISLNQKIRWKDSENNKISEGIVSKLQIVDIDTLKIITNNGIAYIDELIN